MNFYPNQVYSIKIANGDELVAKIMAVNPDSIEVSHPLTVLPGQQGIQLVPSLFTADVDAVVSINMSNISMFTQANQKVCDSYLESTTGIKPVRSSLLMG